MSKIKQIAANQRLIDEAYAHIKKTGKSSREAGGGCSYADSGCAFSPAIKPKFREFADIRQQSARWILTYRTDVLEDWARALDGEVADKVQMCHDRISRPSGERYFVAKFNNLLQQLCFAKGYEYPGDAEQESLETALRVMLEAHEGQLCEDGTPYWTHVIRVANAQTHPLAKRVALLHDVIEDSSMTMSELRELFTYDVLVAVRLLTRHPEEDYMEYIKKGIYSVIFRQVKKADLEDNMRLDRKGSVSEKDIKRYLKYDAALRLINEYSDE